MPWDASRKPYRSKFITIISFIRNNGVVSVNSGGFDMSTDLERKYGQVVVCGPQSHMLLFDDENLIEENLRRALITYLIRAFPRNKSMSHEMPIHGGHGTLRLCLNVRSPRRIDLISLQHTHSDISGPSYLGRSSVGASTDLNPLPQQKPITLWIGRVWEFLSKARSIEWILSKLQ